MFRIPPPADPLAALAALCCLGTHVIAGIASLLILLPGSPVVRDVSARAAYLTQHPLIWALSWATWTMAALGVFAFYWTLGTRLTPQQPRLLRSVLVLMLLAIGVDVAAQVIYATMAPGLAAQFLAATGDARVPALGRFLWSERLPCVLSGGLANGLYALCGVLLCAAMARDARLPAWLRWVSYPGWLGALAVSTAAIVAEPLWMLLAMPLAIGGFVLWCGAVLAAFFWRVPPYFRVSPSGDFRASKAGVVA